MGRTFSAKELVDCGFISRTLPLEGFREKVLALAEETAQFSAEALKVTKKLIRDVDREQLLKVNEVEMHELTERMKTQESIDSINKFVEDAKRRKASKLAKQQQQSSKL
jgi:peroxisomal 3,2-trans-enoyl-CoA isomerase